MQNVWMTVVVSMLIITAAGCSGGTEVTIGTAPPQPLVLQATLTGDVATVEECLDTDPSLISSYDEKGMTLLHHAAMNSHPDIVALLLNRGANPNAQDMNGDTPLLVAEDYDASDEVIQLLKGGAAQ